MSVNRFFTDTITLEPFLGTDSGNVDLFGPPQAFPGFYQAARSLVRGTDTEQVVSTGQVYTVLDALAAAVPNSRITTASGISSRVISAQPNSSGRPALKRLEHLIITVQ